MGAQASQNPNSGVDFDVMSAAMIRATDQLDLSGALLAELTSKVDEMDAEIRWLSSSQIWVNRSPKRKSMPAHRKQH